MRRRMQCAAWTLGAALVVLAAAPSSAQPHVGAAVVVSRLPARPYTPGTIDRPPSGLVRGAVVFGGASLTRRIGVQGELSIPEELTTRGFSSHPGSAFESTTRHRDTIVSALLRVTAARWCEVFVGGGVTFERTDVTVTIFTYVTGVTSPYYARSTSATLATFTTGVDLPVRLSRRVSLVPTGRIHVVARKETGEPTLETPMAAPSRYVFRLGAGARVEF